MRKLRAFLRDTCGATSIEYAMIAAVISIVIVAGASTIGSRLNAKFLGPVSSGLS